MDIFTIYIHFKYHIEYFNDYDNLFGFNLTYTIFLHFFIKKASIFSCIWMNKRSLQENNIVHLR